MPAIDEHVDSTTPARPLVHLDVEQRVANGKAARSATPRSSHAVWTPDDSRPDRALVFAINDFDETNPGPFEWDVKRLAASSEIAARSREFSAKAARGLALRSVRAYREAMAQFAGSTNLETWYARLDVDSILQRWRSQVNTEQVKRFEEMEARARAKDSTKALSKLARRVDGNSASSATHPSS